MKLGAHIYVDSLEQNAAEALQKLGGACSVTPVANEERYVGLAEAIFVVPEKSASRPLVNECAMLEEGRFFVQVNNFRFARQN